MTTSVYRLNENKTDWFRSQGPRFYSSDFDLKIRVLVGIGDGGDAGRNKKLGQKIAFLFAKLCCFH